MPNFSCKNCVPPKRHQGCHANCEQYKKEKAEWEETKRKMKENMDKTPKMTRYEFDEISYARCKRRNTHKQSR